MCEEVGEICEEVGEICEEVGEICEVGEMRGSGRNMRRWEK